MKALRSFWGRLVVWVRRRRMPVVAGAVVVGLVATAGVVWTIATPTGSEVDCSSLEAGDVGAANALAIACGADVEVTVERTPWASTWANPDGTFRLDMSSVPQAALVNGEWVPIDSTLVVGETSIEVVAPVFPIFLNAGGAAGAGKPLGTIERDGHVFEVWFPLDLPVPTLVESQVFYDFGDGLRLAVTVNADTTGFIPVLEVADPAAAVRLGQLLDAARAAKGLPGSGLELPYPIAVTEGIDVTVDEFSQLQAFDAAGEMQFFSPPPVMWDSSGETIVVGSSVTEVAATNRTVQPSGDDQLATMSARLESSTLVVTPDADMLSSDDTVWPVYIDPAYSGGASQRIAVRTGGYTSTLNQWTNISSTSPGEGTGYCSQVSSCNVQFKQRLVWKFVGLGDISALAGTDVISASFTVNGVHSYNCTPQTSYLWRTTDISAASNWNMQWITPLSGLTDSQRSSCGTAGYRSYDAKAGFVWAADANSSTISLGLYAGDESTMATWKRFTHDATISVNYNRAPNVPTAQKFDSPPLDTCTTGVGRPAVATTTPMLKATFTDPDSTSGSQVLVSPRFEVAPVSNLAAPVWNNWTPQPPAGVVSGSSPTAVVAANKLSNGVAYAWRVQGYDGARYGTWSGWCEFTVDTAAPSTPTVSAVETGVPVTYKEYAERGGVGLQGSFVVSRNADADVVSFKYGFNAPTLPLTAVPDASGNAIITFTPSTAGPVSLTVKSLDAAGNFSLARTYIFTVVTPTEDGIWALDEGSGSLSTNSAGTSLPPMNIIGATWGDGPHELFDSREGDRALVFDGVNDTARTTAPVVDSTDSFAVSAHVILDPTRVGGTESLTVMSQRGVERSGFHLDYSANCPGSSTGCWSFAMPDSGSSSAETVVRSPVPVVGGEWTHLVAEFDAPAQQMRLWVCEVGTPTDPALGEPVQSAIARTAPPFATPAYFELGRALISGANAQYWQGSIDNVRVFSGEVISEAKIRRLCQGAEATDFPAGNNAIDPTTMIGG